ncbi:MAG TPA: lipid A biosynthesis acyltransferase [Bacteroidia bacterium]|jgi:predicted LPLAT superfamily acyltransferase|nr:lipid A biosynthesis acyltransferase [Bacteroidia bacterium]
MANEWQGKTRGGVLGHRIFVFILKHAGLSVAYFFLRFVAFYFLISSRSTPIVYRYFRGIHGYGKWKSIRSTYLNYFVFGQTLLDKVALLSGAYTGFKVDHEGGDYLSDVASLGRGGILISGHIGNWEIAGQLLNRLKTGFHILMFENEHRNLGHYMQKVMQEKSFHVIAIREGEMSHLIELHKAFRNNELVVMHGDRFREGNKTLEAEFMGRKALFPAGPFILAAKFGVPLVIVFAVKEKQTRYHFFAIPPVEVKRARTETETDETVRFLLQKYVTELEKMVKAYPLQWFNYYDFWKTAEVSSQSGKT